MEIAWTPLSEADPERNYLAYAVYAERKSALSYFSFLMRARKVVKQLSAAKGVIGFAARLEFLNRKVARVAVFEDESALKAFAHAGQHALCMKETKSKIRTGKKLVWSIPGSEIPLRLDDVINKIQNQKK